MDGVNPRKQPGSLNLNSGKRTPECPDSPSLLNMELDAQPESKLLASVIDEKAKRTPETTFLRYAGPDWETAGYRSITWKQLAGAVNKAAYLLDELPGQTGRSQTVAYLGPNDARYFFLLAGAIKTGRRLLIPDGRVTVEGTWSLLDQTQCNVWITTSEQREKAKEFAAARPGLTIFTIPSLEHFLDNESTPHYPYAKTWAEAKDEIVFIIHTSGTTGHAKPIYLTNAYICTYQGWHYLAQKYKPRRITFQNMFGACMLTTCPAQWAAGLASLFLATYIDTVIVTLPTDMTFPLNVHKIVKIIQTNRATGLATPPSLIEDFSRDETAFAVLKSLDFVIYAGAQLDKAVGDVLSQYTKLSPLIGSTETGPQPSFESTDVSAWNSFDFVPEVGARFEPVSDDLYELHLDRRPGSERFQGAFTVFRERDTIATRELYSPRVFRADNNSNINNKHNTTRWVFRGRTDDLVKLSWLAKFRAADIEDAIARHPRVRSVYTGGEGREVPFVIIELHHHNNDKEKDHRNGLFAAEQIAFLDEIYDQAIAEVNARDVGEIRIPRETVVLADPARPFPRTLKMTVIRKEVERCYAGEIEAMYRRWEERKTKNHVSDSGSEDCR